MSLPATTIVRLWLWSLALFFATFWLHTRHNDFPFYYHPDEPGKVEQVLGKRPLNFHHPMLMMEVAKMAAGSAKTAQETVEAGRRVSAIFTAGAVVALSLLAYAWWGRTLAVATGLALMLHHQLFELSHYLKEDTALLFGFAWTFLALDWFDRRPRLALAALVGVGCGMAISGKYAGVVILVPVLPVLLARRSISRGRAVLVMAVSLVLTLVLVDLRLLLNWSAAWESFVREMSLVTGGQGGVTQSVPHSRYWSIFLANTTPVMWVLILAALCGAWRSRHELRRAEWCIIAFPFFFALVLSFSPKENDRYFLPATAVFTLLAVGGAQEVCRWLPVRWRERQSWCEGVAVLLLLAAQLPSWTDDRGGLIRYWQAFQRDDTAELTEWLRANVPPTAILAKDQKVRLPEPDRQSARSPLLPFKILSDDYVADLAQSPRVGDLIAKGVSYVVITDSTFKKFERQDLKPKADEAAEYERRKQFYTSLRRDFATARTWRRGTVVYLHPGLEVYYLGP